MNEQCRHGVEICGDCESNTALTYFEEKNKAIEDAATRMRERCVSAVKAMAAEVEHGDALLSAKKVITALSSLTLDGEKEQ